MLLFSLAAILYLLEGSVATRAAAGCLVQLALSDARGMEGLCRPDHRQIDGRKVEVGPIYPHLLGCLYPVITSMMVIVGAKNH